MPQLLRLLSDQWTICEEPATDWLNEDAWEAGQSLQVGVDSEPSNNWLQASAIAIEFPAFTDGRGLSLAVLLRTRLAYKRDLVARGNIHEDISHFLARCGFNVIELPNGRNVETALKWISPYRQHYQGSVVSPTPPFSKAL